jgi:phosphoribosylamine--glycine ligase
LKELRRRELLYRGVLYIGLMITPQGPSVLEYNTRFGDPEAQALLPLLEGDWGHVFAALAEGRLPDLKWKKLASACVVLAAEGYPERPRTGVRIEGLLEAETPSSYFLHAGTKKTEGGWVTAGGRVLNSMGIGSSVQEALKQAYAQSEKVSWPALQMREDIGRKILAGLKLP